MTQIVAGTTKSLLAGSFNYFKFRLNKPNASSTSNLANPKLELKKCIPEIVTTFLVLLNLVTAKKHNFTKDQLGDFNYSINFYMICTKLCYKGLSY